jgi:hypothetical protein
MKRLLVLLPLLLGANEDFISHYEYGEMLYSNPRKKNENYLSQVKENNTTK